MSLPEMLMVLWERSPYLLGGYGYNLLISALAMLIGTLVGCLISLARQSEHFFLKASGSLLTSLCRNVPSFVLMFYIAFVLPVEVAWDGSLLRVPLWLKAMLALVIPVIGFASDQGLAYLRQRKQAQPDAGAVFSVAWVQYFLIVLMASATASVIGADEIVGRANRVIAMDNNPLFLLLTYSYVCLWFLFTGLLVSYAIQVLQRHWQNSFKT